MDGMVAVATTNDGYPSRIAFELLLALLRAFQEDHPNVAPAAEDGQPASPSAQRIFNKYLKPLENDKILQIKRDLEETKLELKKDIELLLARGERLEDLIARSEDLSWSSRKFLKQSEELNRCCTLI